MLPKDIADYTPDECILMMIRLLKETFADIGKMHETLHTVFINSDGTTGLMSMFPSKNPVTKLLGHKFAVLRGRDEYCAKYPGATLYAVLFCEQIYYGSMIAGAKPDLEEVAARIMNKKTMDNATEGVLVELHYKERVEIRIYPFEWVDHKVQFDGTEVLQPVPADASNIQALFPK